MGDMNAKIGKQEPGEHMIIGSYGYGNRNKRGQMFIDFCHQYQLKITNTSFNKPEKLRWTWLSPDGKTRNEIDFITTNSAKYVENVEVLSRLLHSSDHRMVRVTLNLSTKKKSRTQYQKRTQCFIDYNKFEKEFLEYTKSNNVTVQTYYDNLESTLIKCSTSPNKPKINEKIESVMTHDVVKLQTQRNQLRNKHNKTKQDKLELSKLYREINKKIKTNLKNYRSDTLCSFLKKTGGIKKAYKKLNTTKSLMTRLNNETGSTVTNRNDLMGLATQFYQKLYSRPFQEEKNNTSIWLENTDPAPPFLKREIEISIKKLKTEKSPGSDGITNEMIMEGLETLTNPLRNLFNLILQQKRIPAQWECSEIVLIYKKGNPNLISNYRPISLMSSLYKVFTSTLLRRITKTIDENQPVEQAGFRSNYSTVDHIHTLKQVIEKYIEFDKSLYIVFIDYSKAFDSISHQSIWEALKEQGVNNEYIEIIKEIYRNSTARVRLEAAGPKFKIERGVKQGDPLSPKLFIAVLENIFRKSEWENMGVKINGKYLSHLRFADDLILLSENPEELQTMIESLNKQSRLVGLEVNQDKTKVMTNKEQVKMKINSSTLEYVEDYTYLGHVISFKACNEKEIRTRIKNTWNKYWAMKEIFKSSIPPTLKTKAMNTCLLPCLTYASQTWSLTKKQQQKIRSCQRGLERSYMNIRLKDRVKTSIIKNKTKAKDVTKQILKQKWRWAGHIQRLDSQRWAQITTNWIPLDLKRKRGRPFKRWEDDIVRTAGNLWPRTAQDRKEWKQLEEAFTALGGPYIEDL